MTHKRPGRRAKAERLRRQAEHTPAGKLLTEIFTDQGGNDHGNGQGGTKTDHTEGDTQAR